MDTQLTQKTKNYIVIFLIFEIFLSFFLVIISKIDQNKLNSNILFSFILNGGFWLLLFIYEIKERPYSLRMMQWLFCLFFFFLAPLIQYVVGYFPWIVTRSENILFRANILLSFWTVSVLVGNYFGTYFKKKKSHKDLFRNKKTYSIITIGLTIISVLNLFYRFFKIGFINMLFRSSNTGVQLSSNASMSVVIEGIIRSLVYFNASFAVIRFRRTKKHFFSALFTVVILTFSYFPTGIARYAVAVLYLGLILTFFTQFKKNRLFVLIFILSFSVILPFFSAFRIETTTISISQIFKNIAINLVSDWVAFDYDAYTLFTLTIEHVDKLGFGYGIHFLTDLLFWVPRSLWPSKAYSGSYEVATELNLFNNLSFPFPALGYIDGGCIGIFLLGIFVGLIMKVLDDLYWNSLDYSNGIFRAYDYLYPCLVIFWFFLCRGDMFYIFGYIIAFVIGWYLLVHVSNFYLSKYIRYFKTYL